jgi:hypothetical protein
MLLISSCRGIWFVSFLHELCHIFQWFMSCLYDLLCPVLWWRGVNKHVIFRFLWPCTVSKVWRERKNQEDAIIRCLLSTSVSTCFGHHYAHLQENKDRVTAYGVLLWFCWMWLVTVVGRCVVGCEHCSHPTTTNHIQQNQSSTPYAVKLSLFSWRWA